MALALIAGEELAEHASPGPATLFVLRGRAELRWQDAVEVVSAGHWATIPRTSHAVRAHEDAVILLTVGRET